MAREQVAAVQVNAEHGDPAVGVPADGERRGEFELAERARRGPWPAGRGLPPVPDGPALHRERVHSSDAVADRPRVAGLPLAMEARQPLRRRATRVHVVGAVRVEDRGLLRRPAGRQASRHGLHVVPAMLHERHACAVARVDLGGEPGESGDGDVVRVVAGQVGGGAGVGDPHDRWRELGHDAREHGEEVAVPVVIALPDRRPVGQQGGLEVLEVVAEDRHRIGVQGIAAVGQADEHRLHGRLRVERGDLDLTVRVRPDAACPVVGSADGDGVGGPDAGLPLGGVVLATDGVAVRLACGHEEGHGGASRAQRLDQFGTQEQQVVVLMGDDVEEAASGTVRSQVGHPDTPKAESRAPPGVARQERGYADSGPTDRGSLR